MRIGNPTSGPKLDPNGFWRGLIRLSVLAFVTAAVLALLLVGFLVLLPVVIIGGIALHFYIRRKLRTAQWQRRDDVIEAEYTVIKGR